MFKLKVCIVGDIETGKTALIRRYIYDKFDTVANSLGGSTFYDKTTEFDGNKIVVQLWDGSGKKGPKSLPIMFQDTSAVIIVYDITQRDSFENLEYWINSVEKYSGSFCGIYLVGTKLDCQEKREVMAEEGEKFAAEYGIPFFETSSFDGSYVKELIHNICSHVFFVIYNT
ncbi:unnamed protein product [Moneuplotes crassus]|uniref:Uncharacterized protein n=1 Tax=Euplotes crassus TaxID=5936 RepID=A0AAD1Y5N8_EUPCR|nr:unnamed protein product [Moneuplotes crassus]